jgi:hypothetical protein
MAAIFRWCRFMYQFVYFAPVTQQVLTIQEKNSNEKHVARAVRVNAAYKLSQNSHF